MLSRPADLFDRVDEWSALTSFATDERRGAQLAIVYGRRRQGKSLLLEHLQEATGGFLFTALEQSAAQSLEDLGAFYSAARGVSVPVRFPSWADAVDEMFRLGEAAEHPVPVILDEFPHLVAAAPELPSVVQAALQPRGRARQRSRTRLILCGSAFSTMRDLLGGPAPLRGRAPLELQVDPFDFRTAAQFWGLGHDWDLAFRVNALCGGTPAYLDYCGEDTPTERADFDAWVGRTLLNPASAFFREGRVLLSEESSLSDLSLYFSVLTAIGNARTRPGEIAAALGRKETALAHPLTVLQQTRLVARRPDILRQRRSTYHIAEPILRLHQLVIRPHELRLTRRQAGRVWAETAPTVASLIYGPHFEDLAREWAAVHADESTLGGTLPEVGRTVVSCREHRKTHQVDLVARAGDRIVALGEAKWRSGPVGAAEVARLAHIRDLLPRADGAKLILFSRGGFDTGLARTHPDVELVDLDRLYTGS